MSKENHVNNPDITEDTSSVIRDDSDAIAKSDSESAANVVTTSSTSVTTSSNDISTPITSTSQQTPPKAPKQPSSQKPIRKTRTSKAVSTAENSSNSSVDKVDSISAPPINIPNSTVPAFDISSGQSANISRRHLPQKDVTQANIANRYVEFILYCNPSAPSDLDVTSLIRSFNAVPKSDGKTFETWVLFQLVSKHHSGEIKTWTKLAQQLGVERTSGSSPQKIQQYAVRLKVCLFIFHSYLSLASQNMYSPPKKKLFAIVCL
ncbi:15060_t:CDS:1 [Cetraspora pellucida]|uniref:15060_t:CDS:1 n=1 Tax=Cetraspora pellucida TaxID=1433469 RepID=A0A9N8W821_9GLOM|nr:15060_t:CDS:1 [Cetraspora pellucida]